jgi:hypothetical protein
MGVFSLKEEKKRERDTARAGLLIASFPFLLSRYFAPADSGKPRSRKSGRLFDHE